MAARIRDSGERGFIAGEDRVASWDFASFPEIAAGETLESAVVTTSPVGLTVAATSVSGDKILARITGGVAGVTYDVVCIATTDAGSEIGIKGTLKVE
jgi:hypothetical protein